MSKSVKIFQGPQHPGITGNMSVELDVIGENIQKATTHVGYLHRGFEKLIERRTLIQAFTIVCRICVPEPDPNEENFARAIETLNGIEVSQKAQYIRVLVLELSRIQALLLWMAGQAGSLGLGTISQLAIGDRDLILSLFEKLTGGRVYHMYIYPGGVRRELPEGFLDEVRDFLNTFEIRLEQYKKALLDNASFKSRAMGVGVVNQNEALTHGYTGQVLRGCGIKRDVRKDRPYLVYDGLDFDVPIYSEGDVYARAMVRFDEIRESIKILRQVIIGMPKEGAIMQKLPKHRKFTLTKGDTFVKSESARGEYSYYVAGDGSEYIRRLQVRGASIVHGFTLLERLLIGEQIGDVAMIMVSLGICPPEIER